MATLLSIDLPWGSANVVGAALARIDGGRADVEVHAVEMLRVPPPAARDTEMSAFVTTGVGIGCALPADAQGQGPVVPGMPANAADRGTYLDRVAAALDTIIARMPGAANVDCLLLDIPFVPASVAHANPPLGGRQSNMRPVERAFQSKVRVPLAGAPGATTNFARFQSGVARAYRPGQALVSVAQSRCRARSVIESFPQLIVGALAEMAVACALPAPSGLTGHKKTPFAGQAPLLTLISHFFGTSPRWLDPALPAALRADGIDALLGLLPAAVLSGLCPPGPPASPWARAVKLRNHDSPPPQGFPVRPRRARGQTFQDHALQCRPWIDTAPFLAAGVDQTGIYALDLKVWQ